MQTQRGPADDETIAEGCQYELSSIAAALIDEEAGASKTNESVCVWMSPRPVRFGRCRRSTLLWISRS